jgi:hypothetical protein
MVVALIALFVALGGAAVAAIKLPRNSVGTAQLVNGAVTGSKLGNAVVTSVKVRDHSLLAKDFRVGQLSVGGNSDVFVSNVSAANVFLWKVVAGQVATSLTLGPGETDFGSVTSVSQVTWQGTSPAGTLLIVASAFSDGSVCHFNAWGIQDP